MKQTENLTLDEHDARLIVACQNLACMEQKLNDLTRRVDDLARLLESERTKPNKKTKRGYL